MYKKLSQAALIITFYIYGTPANATLFPDQDLDENPTPVSLQPFEPKLEAVRAEFNRTQNNFVILRTVYQSNNTNDDVKSKAVAAGEAFQKAVSRLEYTSKALGTLLLLFVNDTQKAYDSDLVNPVWRLVCGGLVGTPASVYRGLDEEFVQPLMQWVREHGGWKTADAIENEIISVEGSVVTVVNKESDE